MIRPTVVADAVADAACWHLLALLFRRPEPRWADEVRALAAEVPDVSLRALAGMAARAGEGEYLALLGPGGRVPAREVGHAGWRDPGWILADLSRYYDAFGYTPSAEDPADHVAVEVDFVAYLLLKHALALEAHDDEGVEITRAARDTFVAAHLAPFAGGLARRLGPEDPPHVAGAADLLAARMPAPTADTMDRDTADADPLADGCGTCGA